MYCTAHQGRDSQGKNGAGSAINETKGERQNQTQNDEIAQLQDQQQLDQSRELQQDELIPELQDQATGLEKSVDHLKEPLSEQSEVSHAPSVQLEGLLDAPLDGKRESEISPETLPEETSTQKEENGKKLENGQETSSISPSSSESSSSEDSSSEEDSLDSDDSSEIPRTVNEITVPEKYDISSIVIPENASLQAVGTVYNIVEDILVIQGIRGTPILDLDNVLCLEDKTVIGKVNTTSGIVNTAGRGSDRESRASFLHSTPSG